MRYRQRLGLIHLHPAFPTVERVLVAIQRQGFEAVLAGGCVRDALLGVPPKDMDVATSAPPDAVESLFANTVAVGKAFGTIVVVENGFNIEVTTYRSEQDYVDGRHPSKVSFTSMEEDSKRRDFTVNALYYDAGDETIYDFASGLGDLRAKRLRTVGLASDRFQEDHLRLLRAARFISQLGFQLSAETFQAMSERHQLIADVSMERVFNEMRRLLEGTHMVRGLEILRESQLHVSVWPELTQVDLDRLKRFLRFMSWENAFAAICLLADADPEVRLRAWKAPRDAIKAVRGQMEAARLMIDPKSRKAERLLALGGAHFAGTLVIVAGLLELKGQGDRLDEWVNEFLNLTGPSGELPKPWVSGSDLLRLGLAPSPKFGELLRSAFEAQIEGRLRSREEALQWVVARAQKEH